MAYREQALEFMRGLFHRRSFACFPGFWLGDSQAFGMVLAGLEE